MSNETEPVLNNMGIATVLRAVAHYKAINGSSPYSYGAFNKVADIIENWDENPLKVSPQSLPGIGAKTAKAIKQIAQTGTTSELIDLVAKHGDFLDLIKIKGVGAKRAQKLHNEYGISTREQLLELFKKGKIEDQRMLDGLNFSMKSMERIPRPMIERRIVSLLASLEPLTDRLEVVGSIRRKRDTSKDVDILVVASDRPAIMAKFKEFGKVLSAGDEKSSILVDGGSITFQVDLLCVELTHWGAALNYFTGSKAHNIALRTLAKAKNIHVCEHGIFEGNNTSGKLLGGENEEDLYTLLGLPFVPPELREGEVIYIEEGKTYAFPGNPQLATLPELLTEKDLISDWHTHTTFSDGQNSMEDMVITALKHGLKEIGFSDHAASAAYGHKLTDQEFQQKMFNEGKRLGEKYPEIKIFVGAEVDIGSDGEVKIPEGMEDADFLIASVHNSLDKNLTERFSKALEHPKVKIIGHATGKAFGSRPEGEADWPALFEKAAALGVAFEVNGQPSRLDLSDKLCKKAMKAGCKLVLVSDAHSTAQIKPNLEHALSVVRRAGCSRKDIALTFEDLG